jgi:hypothetical protein
MFIRVSSSSINLIWQRQNMHIHYSWDKEKYWINMNKLQIYAE